MTESTYERIIQIVRICTAVAFALSGTGLVICANLGMRDGAFEYGMAAVASLMVVAILIAEQLVVAWIRSKRARFSVAALLVLMTACSVLFAVMRWSLGFAVALLVLTLTLISIALEGKRRTNGHAARETRSAALSGRGSVRGS